MTPAKRRERASAVCVHEGRVLFVQMRDPTSGARFMSPPGGAIDAGETPAEAAVRETKEETGYDVLLSPGAQVRADYEFLWNGERYDVTTHFLLSTVQPQTVAVEVNDADYIEGHRWVPFAEVPHVLDYHRDICEAVVKLLRAGGHSI